MCIRDRCVCVRVCVALGTSLKWKIQSPLQIGFKDPQVHREKECPVCGPWEKPPHPCYLSGTSPIGQNTTAFTLMFHSLPEIVPVWCIHARVIQLRFLPVVPQCKMMNGMNIASDLCSWFHNGSFNFVFPQSSPKVKWWMIWTLHQTYTPDPMMSISTSDLHCLFVVVFVLR